MADPHIRARLHKTPETPDIILREKPLLPQLLFCFLLQLEKTLLSIKNAKNRLRDASQKVDARSNGGKQRKLAQQKATEVMLQLLQEAKAAAIPVRHVLFDTWFCSPASLLKIHGLGYEVVAMAKKTEKIHYLHQEVIRIYGKR